MLTITIPGKEFYDEKNNTFVMTESSTLTLEHSLVSISKWESKWKKPFIGTEEKTQAEILDYIKCMTISQNVNPMVYSCLSKENMKAITDYIADPMTASWISEHENKKKSGSGKAVTSELIYYWMIACEIPFECQKWHLNRLLMLIRICNEENKEPKKYNNKDLMRRNTALNAARRKKLGTKG